MTGPYLLNQMRISSFELFLYCTAYISILLWGLNEGYQTTHREEFKNLTETEPDSLGILTDYSDEEWVEMTKVFRQVWWLAVIYLVFSKSLRQRVSLSCWSFVCGVTGVAFTLYFFTLWGSLLFAIVVGSHAAVALLFRSRLALWTVHVANFIFMSSDMYDQLFTKLCHQNSSCHPTLMYAVVALVAVRCFMFFHDNLPPKTESATPLLTKANACTFLHFVFYPPTTFGPIFTYGDFKKSLCSPLKTKYSFLAFRVVRLLAWMYLLHASQYIFYPSLLRKPEYLTENDDVAFACCLYLNGLRFYLFYVQAYGWPNVWGSFDGFEMPEWPRCISHVFSYTEMWKVFDTGLYSFIKNYIYIPCNVNRGVKQKLIASSVCFIYVFVFHGAYFNIFLWVLMNFFQVCAEMAVIRLYYSDSAKPLSSFLSPAWTRRLLSVIGGLSMAFSWIGFFYFDIGFEITNVMIRKCGTFRFWATMLTFSYCLVQLSIECRVRGIYKTRQTPPSSSECSKKKIL